MSNYFFGDNPDRPDTPEFWQLSEILLDHDAASNEEGKGFEVITRKYIHESVIAYAGIQRALRMMSIVKERGGSVSAEAFESLTAALWMDGFLAGAAYATKYPRESDDHPSS